MILVADSGSTKCDWLLMGNDENFPTSTMGFNPYFHSAQIIQSNLADNTLLAQHKEKVHSVFYYGAGCSSEDKNLIVRNALETFFPNLYEIIVDHDIKGAALATCAGEAGIVCILGTGSNSCYFDGEVVLEKIPALGHMLGDEGSGAFFGKLFLSKYLRNQLPEEVAKIFRSEPDLSKENVLFNVYNKPHPNVYLASFMRIIGSHKDIAYIHDKLYNGLSNFAELYILAYDEYRSTPVHFVGSIAHHFSDILNEVAKNMGFTIGTIIQKPIDSLAEFHRVKN